jgi:hypothetical protein
MNEQELNKLFRDFIRRNVPVQSIICRVTAVDETNFTCTAEPRDGGAALMGIRLKPVVNTTALGVIAIPKTGSDIIVGILNNNKNYAFVSVYGEVKRYLVKTDSGSMYELKDDGTVDLNGNNQGGLAIVSALTTKLNAMVSQVNAQLALIATGIIAGGGSYTPTNVSTFTAGDFENPKVKHGN